MNKKVRKDFNWNFKSVCITIEILTDNKLSDKEKSGIFLYEIII